MVSVIYVGSGSWYDHWGLYTYQSYSRSREGSSAASTTGALFWSWSGSQMLFYRSEAESGSLKEILEKL